MENFKAAAENKDERAYLALAGIYERRGEIPEAKRNFLYAMKTRYAGKSALPFLAFCLRNNDFACAGPALQEILKSKPDDDVVLKLLPKENFPEVQQLLLSCAGKGLSRAYLILGKYFLALNDLDGAGLHLRIAIQKGCKEARVLLAKIYHRQKNFSQARAEYKNALKEKVDCYMDFAEHFEQTGCPDNAAVLYRMAIDMGHDDAYGKLIPLLVEMNKLTEAQILIELANHKKIPLQGMSDHIRKSGKTGMNTDQREIPRDELN